MILDWFIHKNLFPTHSKRLPTCLDGEMAQPPTDEPHPPVPVKQRRFSPEKSQMITEEVDTLLERSVIRPWKSS